MRMGTLDTASITGIDGSPSMHDEQLLGVTKELVLPTALVMLHVLGMIECPIADSKFSRLG